MKKVLIYILCILGATLVISAVPVSGEEDIYDSVIRFHIIANSDDEKDQKIKLELRDYIFTQYHDKLSSYNNISDAKSDISENLGEIEETAEQFLKEHGYDYNVHVTLTEEYYPTRTYDTFTLPSGNYTSLRIIIGEGEGHNWWCVLFPPMCLESATGDIIDYSDVSAGLTESQYRLISESEKPEYNVKFRVLEILEEVCGR